MATEHTSLDCGCEILVYGDGSAAPEVIFCDLHEAAPQMAGTLNKIAETLEARAKEHHCMGIHCSECSPMELVEMAREASFETK